jgi:hypothetical protein
MQLIEQWMKGSKNFVVGRSLYKRFGTNDKLKALLDKGETPHAKQELVKELTGDREYRCKGYCKAGRQAI